MSRVDYGTVEVEVGDEVYVLSPTIECVRKMKRWGLSTPLNAIEACRGFDPETLATVIVSGSGKGQKDISPMTDAVHYEGTVNVAPKVIEFLALLMNPTGKEPDGDEEPKEGE
jgi:hypothetical protein